MSSPETQPPDGPDRPTLVPPRPLPPEFSAAPTVDGAQCLTPVEAVPDSQHSAATRPTVTDAGTPTAPEGPLPNVPGYRLVRRLGGGGMGEVYEAVNALGRRFALKVIRRDRHGDEFRDRFRKEAGALLDLDHPNVARIFEYREEGGALFFTMRLLTGGTLAARRRDYRGDPRRAIDLLATVADAVGYLHARGLLHRDLKPANILFDEDGKPFVSDLGLVKCFLVSGAGRDGKDSVAEEDTGPVDTAGDSSGTAVGQMIGTLRYMPPEQVEGDPAATGPWGDVWALGVMLYELLTGRLPFDDRDGTQLRRHIVHDEPPLPRELNPTLDPDLERITLHCLAKRPTDRYPSAVELARELQAWLRPAPSRRGVRRATLAGLSAAVVLGVAAVFVIPADPPAPEQPAAMGRQLTRGEPVAFLGAKGMPLHHRILTGPGVHVWKHGDDEALSIDCERLALVEILQPPVGMSYRFRVQVRQNSWISGASRAGIYCLHAAHATREGPRHTFVELSVLEDDRDLRDSDPKRQWQPGERLATVATFARLSAGPAERNDSRALGLETFEPRKPAPGAAKPWRELVFEVTPQGVKAYHGVRAVGPALDLPALERRFASLLGADMKLPPLDRGGLGLYVLGCSASFRLGAVEPFQPPKK